MINIPSFKFNSVKYPLIIKFRSLEELRLKTAKPKSPNRLKVHFLDNCIKIPLN